MIAACGGAATRLQRDGTAHQASIDALNALIAEFSEQRTAAAIAVRQRAEMAERPTIRSRVLQLLDVPRRPVELVDALNIDPSKVSRALAELRDANRVVALGRDDADRRARRYVATTQRDVLAGRALGDLLAVLDADDSDNVTITCRATNPDLS